MSLVLDVHLDLGAAHFTCDGVTWTVPVGSETLTAMLATDPPAPDELTNAIGLFVDHLEDVTREVPAADLADEIHVRGPGLDVLTAVEVGEPVPLPHTLDRRDVEALFRTLATESDRERALNPGLPAPHVRAVLGTCCAVVAVLRGLDRQHLQVREVG